MISVAVCGFADSRLLLTANNTVGRGETMATYYTNNEGTVFCRHRYFVQYFDLKTKEWETASWNVTEWQAENLAPDNAKVVEITETQAKEKMHDLILDNLDRIELKRFIDMLCQTRTINWNPMTQREDGVYTLGYPRYPDGLFDIFEFLGCSEKYRDHMETWPKKLLPTDMDLWQIQTALTYLVRAERFCDGVIADAVEDGTILKLLLRLEDLLNAHQGKAQHW